MLESGVRPFDGISRGSEELQSYMPQHRTNSIRGKMIDKM